jgi:predicted aspartyl protease
MRRNVLVHGWLLTFYYVSLAIYAIAIQSHANKYASDCVFMGIQILIFLGWATLLSRRGETVEIWPEVTKAEYDATTAAKEQLLRIAREL